MSSPAGKHSKDADGTSANTSSTTSRHFLTPQSRGAPRTSVGRQRLSPKHQAPPVFGLSQESQTNSVRSSPSQAFTFSSGNASSPTALFNSSPTPPVFDLSQDFETKSVRSSSSQAFNFNFGEASNPAVLFNSSPTPHLPLFPDTSRTQINADFTFRSLHNASPTPSPQPSPQQPARTTPGQLPWLSQPDFSFSSLTLGDKQTAPIRDSRAGTLFGQDRSFAYPTLRAHDTNSINKDSRKPDKPMISAAEYKPVPYNVLDEQAPAHPLFTATFQSALKSGTDIAKALGNTIKSLDHSMDSYEDLQRILQDAEELSSFSAHNTRTVAVLGDSGQGKSSIINSLLHFPDIAKTGDLGSACTSVVTEYRQRRRDHSDPITVEVVYLSPVEIGVVVKELLWSYRQLFLSDIETVDVSGPDYARYTRESEQAWSALEAAFKHQKEFQKHMLQDNSEGAFERIQSKLIEWTQDMEWPNGGDNGLWKTTAKTADECWEKTSIFMQDRYWPFTKIIRIYLNSKILKTGLVLADLPGLQDTNLARVKATQDYILKCNNILLVTNISRAVTDQSLKSSIYKVLSQHVPLAWEESGGKGMNIAVICTRSEDINTKSAIAEFCGSGKSIDQAVLDEIEQNIEEAKRTNDKTRKKQEKRKKQLLLMQARNKHVQEGLQAAYASKVPGKKLDVFCVSNMMYEKYSRKGNAELVRASCIPELRQFCYSITADAQFREATHFLRSPLSNLLSSFELCLNKSQSSSQEQEDGLDESIYQIVNDVAAEIIKAPSKLRAEFEDCFKEQILLLLAQYYAFCLNNGHHSTLKRPSEDWNAKILWKMRMELQFQWEIVGDEIPALFESLFDTVKSRLEYLKDQLQNSSSSRACNMLVEGIDARTRGIEYSLGLLRENFATEMRLIQGHASESNSNSLVLNEMISAYRAASSLRGQGRARRQVQIVQGRIEDGTIFPNMSISIANQTEKAVKKIGKDLKTFLSKQMILITNDLDLAISSQEKDNRVVSQQNQEAQQLLLKKAKTYQERYFAILESIASIG